MCSRNPMKKTTVCIFFIAICFAICSCGNNNTDTKVKDEYTENDSNENNKKSEPEQTSDLDSIQSEGHDLESQDSESQDETLRNGYYVAKSDGGIYEVIINPDLEDNYFAMCQYDGAEIVDFYESTYEQKDDGYYVEITDTENNITSELIVKTTDNGCCLESEDILFQEYLLGYEYIGDDSTDVEDYLFATELPITDSMTSNNIGSQNDDYPYLDITFPYFDMPILEAIDENEPGNSSVTMSVKDRETFFNTDVGNSFKNDPEVDFYQSNGRFKGVHFYAAKGGKCVGYIEFYNYAGGSGTVRDNIFQLASVVDSSIVVPDPIKENYMPMGGTSYTWRINNGYMSMIEMYDGTGFIVRGMIVVPDKNMVEHLKYPEGTNPYEPITPRSVYSAHITRNNRDAYLTLGNESDDDFDLMVFDTSTHEIFLHVKGNYVRDDKDGVYIATVTNDEINAASGNIEKEIRIVPIHSLNEVHLTTTNDSDLYVYLPARLLYNKEVSDSLNN